MSKAKAVQEAQPSMFKQVQALLATNPNAELSDLYRVNPNALLSEASFKIYKSRIMAANTKSETKGKGKDKGKDKGKAKTKVSKSQAKRIQAQVTSGLTQSTLTTAPAQVSQEQNRQAFATYESILGKHSLRNSTELQAEVDFLRWWNLGERNGWVYRLLEEIKNAQG
jgi:hypothetical protein